MIAPDGVRSALGGPLKAGGFHGGTPTAFRLGAPRLRFSLSAMPPALAKKTSRLPVAIPVHALKPVLQPIIKPVVERLDKHEELLVAMKGTLDVQFRRIAAMQAQLDHLIAALSKRP
jgi:hypothetical protein